MPHPTISRAALDRADTDAGRVAGTRSPDAAVATFRGIPYAAPPVGPLRWRPPQPALRWDGVRPADRFGPRCVQPDRPTGSISYLGPAPQSEDCLTLNVTTAATAPDEGLPVMVWFHGGAFYLGSNALPLFDGDALARRGVVLVTVNYRLGRLGFLSHPALSRESGGSSGNWGLMDQIAALDWVRRNIAAFGGDPERVTAFGQSAGSISVACHMASPLAFGLFHRAIGQSGGAFGPVGETSGTGDSFQTLEPAERSGADWAAARGARTADDLRALTAEQVQLPQEGLIDPSRAARGAFDTAFPVIDGHVLPESPYTVFAEGRQAKVPLISGFCANEPATMPAAPDLTAYRAQATAEFGAEAERFLALYPATTDDEARTASGTAFGYRNFLAQNAAWADLHRQSVVPVYHYRFTQVPPIPPDRHYFENRGDRFGAFHGAEIPYIFGTFAVRDWPWTDADRALGETIAGHWTAFAASGNPNARGLPDWPRHEPGRDPHPIGADRSPAPHHAERLAFWDDWFSMHR